MSQAFRYARLRWPDTEVPSDCPEWLFYELDEPGDRVVRTVEQFADGSVRRNSIALEERDGRPNPSLIDLSLAEGFEGLDLEDIDPEGFERLWTKGIDAPFWNA